MVSINVANIASKLKDGAKVALNNLKENPPEGSIFDAAQKLGINNKEDLQAGIELFKENPQETMKVAAETLSEKGFDFGAAKAKEVMSGQAEGAEEGAEEGAADGAADGAANTKKQEEFGGILGKLGIKSLDDLQGGIKKFFEKPAETTKAVGQAAGLSDNLTEKLAGWIGKLFKK